MKRLERLQQAANHTQLVEAIKANRQEREDEEVSANTAIDTMNTIFIGVAVVGTAVLAFIGSCTVLGSVLGL